jgi:hypothetical protein
MGSRTLRCRTLPDDPSAEPRQQIAEYFAGALVLEPKPGIESLVRLGHQELGRRQDPGLDMA